jgi:transposase InsO family protein
LRLSARARGDLALRIEVRRVFCANYRVYDVREVWRQLQREGFDVARCTVARLMRAMGLAGVIRGKPERTTWVMVQLRSGRIRHARMGRLVQSPRLLEPIGKIPPAEADEQYYAVPIAA